MYYRIFIIGILSLFIQAEAIADCVYGAKNKTTFVVVDSHTILLKGGAGPNILIKSFSFFYPTSQLTVLKDSFCSYESAVLYVDGNVVDASEVKKI